MSRKRSLALSEAVRVGALRVVERIIGVWMCHSVLRWWRSHNAQGRDSFGMHAQVVILGQCEYKTAALRFVWELNPGGFPCRPFCSSSSSFFFLAPLPRWPQLGYGPSGLLGVELVVVPLVALLNRAPRGRPFSFMRIY
jgi:hypothetical protein